jgi:hypothetical protein
MEGYELLARNNPGSLFLMNTNMNNSINNNILLSSSSPTMTTIIDVYTGGKRVAQIVENSRCGNELVLSQLQHVLDSNVHIVPLKGDVFSQASSLPIETMEATIAAEYDFESSYENWLPNFED